VPDEIRPVHLDRFNKSLQGAGGWLALFIFTLIFSGPAIRLFRFVSSYHTMQQLFTQSAHSYSVRAFFFVEQLVGFAIRGYGIFAGVQLWKIRPGAVESAKRFLLGLLLLALLDYVSVVVWVILMVPQPNRTPRLLALLHGVNATALLQTSIYVAVWYAYLLRSERVRVTFPLDARLETGAQQALTS
jgi:hypothetical protein